MAVPYTATQGQALRIGPEELTIYFGNTYQKLCRHCLFFTKPFPLTGAANR